jgi:hypothetical protein
MNTVSIQLPPINTESSVEVDVTVNGHRQRLKYRVEVFRWEDWCGPTETRAEGIRKMLAQYDRHWQLMQIGSPTDATVPLMFRHVG